MAACAPAAVLLRFGGRPPLMLPGDGGGRSLHASKFGPQPLSLPSDQTMTLAWFLLRSNMFCVR